MNEIITVGYQKNIQFFERKMLVDGLMLQKKDENGTGVERARKYRELMKQ